MGKRLEFSRKTKAKIIERAAGRCDVAGCEKEQKVRGLCWSHYMRKRRHGTPLGGTTERGAALAFFNALPAQGEGCIIWPFFRDANGCARLVTKDGGTDYVARRICEKLHGKRGAQFQAAHSCGNGHLGCVSPWHLSWKTRHENNADRIVHGTWGTKLTEDQVREIKNADAGLSKQELADLYGVTRQCIGWILSGKGWRHV